MTHNTYTIKKNNINENTFFNDIFTATFKPIGIIDADYNSNDSEALSNLILSSIADKNPGTADLYIKPKKTKLYKFFIGKKTAKKASKINTLMDAIEYLSKYYEPKDDLSHDYIKIELPDGTILRIFDDEIQINDTLLSLDDSAALMKYITPKKQKYIIDFVMKIAA